MVGSKSSQFLEAKVLGKLSYAQNKISKPKPSHHFPIALISPLDTLLKQIENICSNFIFCPFPLGGALRLITYRPHLQIKMCYTQIRARLSCANSYIQNCMTTNPTVIGQGANVDWHCHLEQATLQVAKQQQALKANQEEYINKYKFQYRPLFQDCRPTSIMHIGILQHCCLAQSPHLRTPSVGETNHMA